MEIMIIFCCNFNENYILPQNSWKRVVRRNYIKIYTYGELYDMRE